MVLSFFFRRKEAAFGSEERREESCFFLECFFALETREGWDFCKQKAEGVPRLKFRLFLFFVQVIHTALFEVFCLSCDHAFIGLFH